MSRYVCADVAVIIIDEVIVSALVRAPSEVFESRKIGYSPLTEMAFRVERNIILGAESDIATRYHENGGTLRANGSEN